VLLAFDPAAGAVMPAAGAGGEAVVTGTAGVAGAVAAAPRTGGLGM
jgi:hypothetical protein